MFEASHGTSQGVLEREAPNARIRAGEVRLALVVVGGRGHILLGYRELPQVTVGCYSVTAGLPETAG